MNCVNLLSLNVRGLRDDKKRRELFRWLKKYHNGKKTIILLQETHSSINDQIKWQREWGADILMCHGNKNSRGVAILLPLNTSYDIIDSTNNANGRIQTLTLRAHENDYFIVNIYAPTQNFEQDQQIFLEELFNLIDNNYDKSIIIGATLTYLD